MRIICIHRRFFNTAGRFFKDTRLAAIFLAMIILLFNGCGENTTEQLKMPFTSKTKKVTEESPQQSSKVDTQDLDGDDTYVYHKEGRRDPFKSLLLGIKEKRTAGLTPLQQRSLGELRVIGIVWGPKTYMAMIETPDGKGYVVKKGTLVGPEGGVVKQVTEDSVIIEEMHTDFYGKKVAKTTVLRLRGKEEGAG